MNLLTSNISFSKFIDSQESDLGQFDELSRWAITSWVLSLLPSGYFNCLPWLVFISYLGSVLLAYLLICIEILLGFQSISFNVAFVARWHISVLGQEFLISPALVLFKITWEFVNNVNYWTSCQFWFNKFKAWESSLLEVACTIQIPGENLEASRCVKHHKTKQKQACLSLKRSSLLFFRFILVFIVIESCGMPTVIYFQSFQLEALNAVHFFQLSSSSFIIPTVYLKLLLWFLLCLRNNIETFLKFSILR